MVALDVPAPIPAPDVQEVPTPAVPTPTPAPDVEVPTPTPAPDVEVFTPVPVKRKPRPAKVVAVREPVEVIRSVEVIDPEPLLTDGAILQHMLNHRVRQRVQREEMYTHFVANF